MADEKDCNCKNMRWTLFLVILFGLAFGIVGAMLGTLILGVVGKWVLAMVGTAFGAWAGWNAGPKSLGDMFFWRKKNK